MKLTLISLFSLAASLLLCYSALKTAQSIAFSLVKQQTIESNQ